MQHRLAPAGNFYPGVCQFFLSFPIIINAMRIAPFIISAVITTGLVVAMNKKWGKIPPLGKFVSPQEGFWQNAEPADQLDKDCAPAE